jgi:hypothetical protein
VAEIYEGELQDYAGAIANYERAADYYKGEDSTGSVSQGRRGGERETTLVFRPLHFLMGGGALYYRDAAMERLETVLVGKWC